MENNLSNNQHHSNATMFGVLIIITGLLIAIIAFGEKSRIGEIVGAVITVIGIIFYMIGKVKNKHLIQQDNPSEN